MSYVPFGPHSPGGIEPLTFHHEYVIFSLRSIEWFRWKMPGSKCGRFFLIARYAYLTRRLQQRGLWRWALTLRRGDP